jgi:hypothetical protein
MGIYYTVEREDFTPPAPGGATVACPDQTDTPPMLPNVLDNCMGTLLPAGPPVVSAKPFVKEQEHIRTHIPIAKGIHIHGYLLHRRA